MPMDYLSAADNTGDFEVGRRVLEPDELPIEFMMNVLRLNQGVDFEAVCGKNRAIHQDDAAVAGHWSSKRLT